MKATTQKLIKSAVFVALMAAAANIGIPFPYVQLTFQMTVACLAGLVLGSGYGAAAMLIYAAAGLIGLPFFAGFAGGMQSVYRPSFGFIIGFILVAAVCGAVRNASSLKRATVMFLAVTAGYIIGAVYELVVLIVVTELENVALIAEMVKLPLFFIKDLLLAEAASILYARVFVRKKTGTIRDIV